MSALHVILALAALAAAWRLARAFLRLRGTRVVICPETHEPAAVEVRAGRAALSCALGRRPAFRLRACSRWPGRAGCPQGCCAQIDAAPEECLVRAMLAKHYRGKHCAVCSRRFDEEDRLVGPEPALMRPDGTTFEWRQFPAERLPAVLKVYLPVCFRCHIAEEFRREYPDLVTDRPDRSGRCAC